MYANARLTMESFLKQPLKMDSFDTSIPELLDYYLAMQFSFASCTATRAL